MQPDSSDQTELLRQLRQQLILSQVRIMELEDARDELLSRLHESEMLRQAAQHLADQKTDAARNLNESLADCLRRLSVAEQENAALKRAEEAGIRQNQTHVANLALAQRQLQSATIELSGQALEIRALKATRSWRWTAWLRALGF